MRAHRGCLKDRPEADAVAQPRPSTDGKQQGRRAEVTRQRHADIHALHATGVGTTAISRVLNFDGKTVRRYPRAATADELLTETVPRPKDLDEHAAHLIRPAGERTGREQADLARILERCDTLRIVDRLVSDFAGMLRQRQGQHLDTWITQARTTGVAHLAGFAAGLVQGLRRRPQRAHSALERHLRSQGQLFDGPTGK